MFFSTAMAKTCQLGLILFPLTSAFFLWVSQAHLFCPVCTTAGILEAKDENYKGLAALTGEVS